MKLHENEKVVKALEDILAKHYPYLEYSAKLSINPSGAIQSKDDRLCVRVKSNHSEVVLEKTVIDDIIKKLEKKTNIQFLKRLTKSKVKDFSIRRF
ncbi:MAG: hypothetical protein OXI67_13380 [Candidatus Poribacteria bacterium]|nr:hypothetical protein [Candidatus Poribacteria bacterium]